MKYEIKKHKQLRDLEVDFSELNNSDTTTELVQNQISKVLDEVDYRIKQAFKNKGFDIHLWSPREIQKRIKAVNFEDVITISCDNIPVCSYGFPSQNDFNVIEENGFFTTEYNYKFQEH